MDRAFPAAATLGAGVGGSGHNRTLGYAYAPNPGQKITFVERGERTTQTGEAQRGQVQGPAGGRRVRPHSRLRALKFSPGLGKPGRREIVAVIEQDGQPRDEKVVATYVAPKDRAPPAPRLVRARRSGGSVLVRWAAVPGATGYTASAILSDGRKLSFAPKSVKAGIRIKGIGRDTTVRIALRAMRLDGVAGKTSRLKVKATRRANVAPRKAKPLKKLNTTKKGGRR